MQDNQVVQEDLKEIVQLSLEQQLLAVVADLEHLHLCNQEDLVVLEEEQVETVQPVELQQRVKEMQVEIQMHPLEKVALAAVELELLVEQVEMLMEQQVEREVHLLLYLL